jgi:uncharacterized protein (TIRG00374 family)
VAIGVLGLLVHFNRLDLETLTILGKTWPWLLAAFALIAPSFPISSCRLQIILRSQAINVSLLRAVRWTMIGSFFDLAMPSATGGDVIKAGYVMNHAGAGMRTRALMAVAFDRLLGMLGLFLLASAVGVLGWKVVGQLPAAGLILVASSAASIGTLLALNVLGARRLVNHPRLARWFTRGTWGPRLKQMVGAFNNLRESPRHFAAALALSLLNHACLCGALYCITRALGHDVDPVAGFVVFPLAIFGNVLGVAGGFGLGTAGFDLVLSRVLQVDNGAVVGLLFQSLSAIARLAGLPYYLSSHREERQLAEQSSKPTAGHAG